MGKNTGFLEYKRENNTAIAPLERISNFKEFHPQLSCDERKKQAARCMNCGVPMCQSAVRLSGMVTGCPLHNLIPEWNDLLYNGQIDMAYDRLSKTSSFPEFTSRVCPALCEKACNCAEEGDLSKSVSVRENELYIIEEAFSRGFVKSRLPKIRTDKKIAVIGSGPSGLACADLLNRRGHNVTVFEREDRVGGLLMYGIPNMKLEKQIVKRRVSLMEGEGVKFVTGADVGRNVSAEEILRDFDAVALCLGAKKPRALNVPGSEGNGVMFAVDFLKSVTKSLLDSELKNGAFFNVEGKNVVVIGGGDTGNDCVGTCIRLGAANVTQLEMLSKPPVERASNNPFPEWPKTLKTDYGQEEAIAKFGKEPRIWETTVKEIYLRDGNVCGLKTVEVEFKMIDGKRTLVEREGSEKEMDADLILVAAGFLGAEDYAPQAFGVPLSARSTVICENGGGYQTECEKVFAAGDARRGQSLVVWAVSEGRECARAIDKYLMGYTNL